MTNVSVRVVQHLMWHLASHKNKVQFSLYEESMVYRGLIGPI